MRYHICMVYIRDDNKAICVIFHKIEVAAHWGHKCSSKVTDLNINSELFFSYHFFFLKTCSILFSISVVDSLRCQTPVILDLLKIMFSIFSVKK